jgi:ribosomal protein L22
MKRFVAKSKGRAGRIIKPFANITVVVHEPPAPAAAPAETKEAA